MKAKDFEELKESVKEGAGLLKVSDDRLKEFIEKAKQSALPRISGYYWKTAVKYLEELQSLRKGKARGLSDEQKQEISDLVMEQAKKGRVVLIDGLNGGYVSYDLKKFISQPTEGLLYDLNRLPEVVMTFIDDPKWIGDYAVQLVIKELKKDLGEVQRKCLELGEINKKLLRENKKLHKKIVNRIGTSRRVIN